MKLNSYVLNWFKSHAQETKEETPNSRDGLQGLKELVYFILYFEIEYRTSRTIKGDSNSGLGWNQVLKTPFTIQIILATNSQQI